MGSARRLFRLNLAVGAAALAAVAFGVAAALRAISLDGHATMSMLAACRRWLTPLPHPLGVAVLGLASLSVAVVVLAARSLLREVWSAQRFLRAVRPQGERLIGGERVLVVGDSVPRAFCAGLLRPRVYLSSGALDGLDAEELLAVVAHERHHRQRRDPLRLLVVRVLADALFFVPVLARLRTRYAQLAEMAADEAAVRALRDPAPLASALLRFGETSSPAVVVGIAPERVDHLLGAPARWELPLSLLVGGLVTVAGLAATAAAVAGSVAPGTISMSALVAQACMTAMTLAPLALGAWLLLLCTRRLRAAGA